MSLKFGHAFINNPSLLLFLSFGSLLLTKDAFFGKRKFDVKQLKINKFIMNVKQLKLNKFMKSIWQLIVSTSNVTFDVYSIRP